MGICGRSGEHAASRAAARRRLCPQLVDELVADTKIVRSHRIQKRLDVENMDTPALQVLKETDENAVPAVSLPFIT